MHQGTYLHAVKTDDSGPTKCHSYHTGGSVNSSFRSTDTAAMKFRDDNAKGDAAKNLDLHILESSGHSRYIIGARWG